MEISIDGFGKRFQSEWVFRRFDYLLKIGNSYAITGPNGSGKSTLMQMIAGLMPATEGKISYSFQGKIIDPDYFFRYLGIASPYLELIEEFTLSELLTFHFKFKKLKEGLDINHVLHELNLKHDRQKQIIHFSSGMKQRLKLGLCFYSDCPVLFLDEPTSNLDEKGIFWYQENIRKILKDRLVIVCSNQPHEYDFCNESINILDFK